MSGLRRFGLCAALAALSGLGCGKDEAPSTGDGAAGEGGAGSSVVLPLDPCDLVARDCPAPEQKCTVIESNGFRSVCARAGNRALGEACTRLAPGDDDCESGAWCTSLTTPLTEPRAHYCRPLCDDNAQCTTPGERCYRFAPAAAETFGVCTPECRLFETECAEGLHCIPVLDASSARFFVCNAAGTAREGAACANADACAAGLGCAAPEGRCRAYCDAAHPCESDRSCVPLPDAEPPDLGLCLTP